MFVVVIESSTMDDNEHTSRECRNMESGLPAPRGKSPLASYGFYFKTVLSQRHSGTEK